MKIPVKSVKATTQLVVDIGHREQIEITNKVLCELYNFPTDAVYIEEGDLCFLTANRSRVVIRKVLDQDYEGIKVLNKLRAG